MPLTSIPSMNEATERFSLLLNHYLQKTIRPAELRELSTLLDTLDQEEIASVLEKIYQNIPVSASPMAELQSETILANIIKQGKVQQALENRRPKKVLRLFLKAAAAAIFVGLACGLIFLRKKTNQPALVANDKTQQPADISPGSNKATLTMSNGATIVLTNSPNGILARNGNTAIKKINDGQLIFEPHQATTDIETPDDWNIISTPRGGEYQLVLPDGSKVWLNAESSLKFPSHFKGKQRSVVLTGEAYFEIAKNTRQVFKVATAQMEVQVLGTDFNLADYGGNGISKTTLINGAVKIKSGKQTQLLKPGQQIQLTRNKQLKLIPHADIETEIAWKNGLFRFKDASIQQVMEQVARWYDIEVTYDNEHAKKLFNGSISRNVNLSGLLNMLAYTGVNYEIKGRKVHIKN